MKYDLGLIPMSAKPFHAGHYYLVQKAAAECHVVKLFVGTGNRTKGAGKSITGDQMLHLWKEVFEPLMPGSNNIQFVYKGVPVRNVYETLDYIKEEDLGSTVAVYSGNEVEKNGKTLIWNRYHKLINDSYWKDTLSFVSVNRGEEGSPDVSGTQMRKDLLNRNKEGFFGGLPSYLEDEKKQYIFDYLTGHFLKTF